MKKDRLHFLLFAPYLLSFVLLVFQYINSNPEMMEKIEAIKKEIGASSISANLMIIFSCLTFSIIVFLIYYWVIFKLLCKINTANIDGENLMVSILITETFCQVFALLFLNIFAEDILRLMIPPIGLFSLGILLYKKYPIRLVSAALFIRGLFYISNVLAVLFGLL